MCIPGGSVVLIPYSQLVKQVELLVRWRAHREITAIESDYHNIIYYADFNLIMHYYSNYKKNKK